MALSGLDIYKLLPKTNCKECGFVTCLAFAMQLAKKSVTIDKCPYIKEEAKAKLEESSLPPIKLISAGVAPDNLDIGKEAVLFRHEEKFYNPCGIGFIIDDDIGEDKIVQRLKQINGLKFERVGQEIKVNAVGLKQKSAKQAFLDSLKVVIANTGLTLVLISQDPQALSEALKICSGRKPIIYGATEKNVSEIAQINKEFNCPLVVSAENLDSLSALTKELASKGSTELILDTGIKPISDRIWDLTQIRRLALKRSQRSLGYPAVTVVDNNDPFEEIMEAASFIAKYSGLVLIRGTQPWQALALLTLRQNIYTDPQKPLQIEPKLYNIGLVNDKSPVLVTTNFSLTYYTVLGEVEASRIPSYILSIDTEGMSVLTAWAAEKFTAEKIADVVNKVELDKVVSHKNLVIPGYVAVMSGDLEEKSARKIIVGPKEASGLSSFLKNLA